MHPGVRFLAAACSGLVVLAASVHVARTVAGNLARKGKQAGRAADAATGVGLASSCYTSAHGGGGVQRACAWCKQVGPGRLVCQQCRQARYCSRSCQLSDWTRGSHGVACTAVATGIRFRFHRLWLLPTLAQWDVLYGNTPAVDLLRLQDNEGAEYTVPMRILCIGSGDLRHVIYTLAMMPAEFAATVQVHVNDINPLVLARNVLLSFLMWETAACKEDARRRSLLDLILALWYSTSLRPDQYADFQHCLSNLLQLSASGAFALSQATDHYVRVQSTADLALLRDVWSRWSRFPLTCQQVQQMRREVLQMPGNRARTQQYVAGIRPELQPGVQRWIETGVFAPPGADQSMYTMPNATLVNQWTLKYTLYYDCIPFRGWYCNEVLHYAKHASIASAALPEMYHAYLMSLLHQSIGRVPQISLRFHAHDGVKLGAHNDLLSDHVVFDRIWTSHVADAVGLSPLLLAMRHRLNPDNPHAVLATGLQNWHQPPNAWGKVLPLAEALIAGGTDPTTALSLADTALVPHRNGRGGKSQPSIGSAVARQLGDLRRGSFRHVFGLSWRRCNRVFPVTARADDTGVAGSAEILSRERILEWSPSEPAAHAAPEDDVALFARVCQCILDERGTAAACIRLLTNAARQDDWLLRVINRISAVSAYRLHAQQLQAVLLACGRARSLLAPHITPCVYYISPVRISAFRHAMLPVSRQLCVRLVDQADTPVHAIDEVVYDEASSRLSVFFLQLPAHSLAKLRLVLLDMTPPTEQLYAVGMSQLTCRPIDSNNLAGASEAPMVDIGKLL